MLANRYVVKAIPYDKSVSISAVRYALKRVTIRKVDLFHAPFAVHECAVIFANSNAVVAAFK